jgi:TetR/AcrR family transcriptional repressor of nem operon
MARPARLSNDEILDRALPVFWRRGFAGTTLDDLEQATGLGRQCLYNQFSDKQGLYRAVLRRYAEHTDAVLAPLREPTADLESIARFFAGARAAQRASRCGGCLIARLAADPPDDADIQEVVRSTITAVRATFAAIIARARASGAVIDGRSPAAIADFLWAVGNGAGGLAASAQGDAACDQAIRLAIELIAGSGRTGAPARRSARLPIGTAP